MIDHKDTGGHLSGDPIDAPPASAPAAVPDPDPAPWGLAGAILGPAMAFGGQVLLATFMALFTRGILIRLDPNLIDQEEALDKLVIQSSLLPVGLGSALLTVGLVCLSIRIAGDRPFGEALGLKAPTAASAGFVIAGMAVALVAVGLVVLFPPGDLEEIGGPMTDLARSGPLGQAIWILLAVGVAPIVEEILFRGYAFAGAKRRLGAVGAGAGCTIVFVSMHLGETGLFWPAIAGITAVAVLLVVIVHRTGNLTHCIACHLGYNAALAALSLMGGE